MPCDAAARCDAVRLRDAVQLRHPVRPPCAVEGRRVRLQGGGMEVEGLEFEAPSIEHVSPGVGGEL